MGAEVEGVSGDRGGGFEVEYNLRVGKVGGEVGCEVVEVGKNGEGSGAKYHTCVKIMIYPFKLLLIQLI